MISWKWLTTERDYNLSTSAEICHELQGSDLKPELFLFRGVVPDRLFHDLPQFAFEVTTVEPEAFFGERAFSIRIMGLGLRWRVGGCACHAELGTASVRVPYTREDLNVIHK